MTKILFITTSVDRIDEDWQSGIWFEELSTPFYMFEDEGAECDIASPFGGNVPFDPLALTDEHITESVERFRADDEAMQKLGNSLTLSDVDFDEYDGIFFPGGHAASVDLPNNEDLAIKLGEFFDSGKPIAALCHGPAGLLRARRADGEPIVKDIQVTSFSNVEEEELEVANRLPILLETRFAELGAKYFADEPFSDHSIRDGNIITGQNPQSTISTAKLFLNAVEENSDKENNLNILKEA